MDLSQYNVFFTIHLSSSSNLHCKLKSMKILSDLSLDQPNFSCHCLHDKQSGQRSVFLITIPICFKTFKILSQQLHLPISPGPFSPYISYILYLLFFYQCGDLGLISAKSCSRSIESANFLVQPKT